MALQLRWVIWGRDAVFSFLPQKVYKALCDYKIIIPAFIVGAMLGDSREASHFNSCKPCFWTLLFHKAFHQRSFCGWMPEYYAMSLKMWGTEWISTLSVSWKSKLFPCAEIKVVQRNCEAATNILLPFVCSELTLKYLRQSCFCSTTV